MYLVCWNHDCRQTYDAKDFNATDRDVKCVECGGTLISPSGKIQLSNNDYVVKTVDPEKYEESKKKFGL
jgi:ribosomal protein S27E